MKKDTFNQEEFRKDMTSIINKYFDNEEKTVDEMIDIFALGYKSKYSSKSTDDDNERVSFEKALESLINSYSMENDSNTPDFILSDYLTDCLDTFNKITNRRNKFYNRKR